MNKSFINFHGSELILNDTRYDTENVRKQQRSF